ncbi:DUF4214 domain-containing protein [Pseudoduganella namucuonensis]|uniref:Ca2+-binding protein, RTX toxin-related n=1 Tax=Pseudoduganella namucuonensis TaxID=1035707 RepID=A0A1I7M5W9_9BURK|nr:DUF4214 domain-containing protein [Pseudoduganella namucuonensis]SFV17351.1 Ca2+-binding protein, RTX toxin-related [Pseudoduganella namucuonensis]
MPRLIRVWPPLQPGGMAVGTDVVLTFSAPVKAGTGPLIIGTVGPPTQTLYELSADSPYIAISGDTLRLRLPEGLAYGTSVDVRLTENFVLDLAGNPMDVSSSFYWQLESQPAPAPVDWTGTALADLFHGSAGADALAGGAGGDSLYGHAGNDVILGGDEPSPAGDFLFGMDGDDILYGEGGDDALSGGAGDDVLDGGADNDYLGGDDGNDTLRGGDGDDRLTEWFGDNAMYGGAGDDTLYDESRGTGLLDGGGGADTLTLAYGSGTLDGGGGNDALLVFGGVAGAAQTLALSGGDGDDRITIRASEAIRVLTASGGAGVDSYAIEANQGNVVTIGDFKAGAGGDIIDLKLLLGEAYSGGNPFGAAAALRLVQRGLETVLQHDPDGAAGGAFFHDAVRLVDVAAVGLTAANFAGGVAPNGDPAGASFQGGEGDDQYTGGASNDTLAGGAGKDTLDGDAGDDVLLGGAGDDMLHGGADDDRVYGGDGADAVSGGNGDDLLEGGAGDDTLNGGDGADRISGGGGLDRASWPLFRGSVTVESSQGQVTVTSLAGTGAGDVDILDGVERLHFFNQGVAFDVDGAAGQIFRLYLSAFGRAPDIYGMGYWLSRSDAGAELGEIAGQFAASTEFQARYGAQPDHGEFVAGLYRDVLHRQPDAAGQAYWTGLLDRHAISLDGVLLNFSESAEHQQVSAAVVGVSIEYTRWGVPAGPF